MTMNTIFTLTATGSCMFLLYLICRRAGVRALKWSKIWLVMAALLYLVPLWGLKEKYAEIQGEIKDEYVRSREQLPAAYEEMDRNISVPAAQNQLNGDILLKWEDGIFAVWMLTAAGMLSVKGFCYLAGKRRMLTVCRAEEDALQIKFLKELCGEFKIRRRVRLYYCRGTAPVSFGLWRPVILLPEEMQGKIPAAVLRHELTHIKNLDILTQCIVAFAAAVHWFNPITHLLKAEFGRVCELICDEEAVRNSNAGDKAAYAHMLLAYADRKGQSDFTGAFFLSKDARRMEERIVAIMARKEEKGKRRAIAAAAALAISLFVSSLMVFAYRDRLPFAGEGSEAATEEHGRLLLQGIQAYGTFSANGSADASVDPEKGIFYEFTFPGHTSIVPDHAAIGIRSTGLHRKESAAAPYVYPEYSEHATWYFLSPVILEPICAAGPICVGAGEETCFTWYDGYGGIGQEYCLSGYPEAVGHKNAYAVSGTWSE